MAERVTPPRRENRGFTLIEMLLVVSIIAILVAVPIPVVGNSLERAKCAADVANERAAKAAATIGFLNGKLGSPDDSNPGFDKTSGYYQYNYDAVSGQLSTAKPAPYGKCQYCKNGYVVVRICPKCGQAFPFWTGDGEAPIEVATHIKEVDKNLGKMWYITHNGSADGKMIDLKMEKPAGSSQNILDTHVIACGLPHENNDD